MAFFNSAVGVLQNCKTGEAVKTASYIRQYLMKLPRRFPVSSVILSQLTLRT